MITLKNENLTVAISEIGAEIKSIKKDGKEYMWQGFPDIWSGTAPLMFPICGGLKDDKFVFEGKEYILPKHGYARGMKFDVESFQEESAVFLHKSNEETLKMYPFQYELRVIYTLNQDGITIGYQINNKSGKTMYFSIGSHEAYSTPEGIEDYDVIFPEKETLNAVMLDGCLLQKNTIPIIKNSNVLPLYDKCFTEDALIFTELKSRSATLRNRKTGKAITVDFPDCPYLLLWHKHSAPYMCVEPWGGIPDYQDSDYDFTKKKGIIALETNGVYNASHKITITEE